jgi:hypothetical protein
MEVYSQEKVMQELIKIIESFNKEITEIVVQINASLNNFSNNLRELNVKNFTNVQDDRSQNPKPPELPKASSNKTLAEAMEEIKTKYNSTSSNDFKKAAAEYVKERKKLQEKIDKDKDHYAKEFKDSEADLTAVNKQLDKAFEEEDDKLVNKRNKVLAEYAPFKEAFDSIDRAAETNFVKMLGGAQTFSQTYKNIFDNMLAQIQTAFSKHLYQQLLQKPINNLLNNIFGSFMGGFGGDSDPSAEKKARGGLARGWSIVGEEGPELVNFSNPARVYTAKETRAALSRTQKTQSPIHITMNVTTPDAGSFRQSRGQLAAGMGRAISSAARRNN